MKLKYVADIIGQVCVIFLATAAGGWTIARWMEGLPMHWVQMLLICLVALEASVKCGAQIITNVILSRYEENDEKDDGTSKS